MSVEAGGRLGPYVLGERLGDGESGERWAASEPGVDRPVALLVTPLPADSAAREAIREGLRRRAALEHPALPPVYGAGEDGDLAWVATRAPLGQPLGDEPASAEVAERIGGELRSALDALASAGIAPGRVGARDVVLEDGRAYLVPPDQAAGGDASAAAADLERLLQRRRRRRRTPSRRLLVIGAAAAVVITAVVVAIMLALGSESSSEAARSGPAGRVVATIPTGNEPVVAIAFDGARAWAVAGPTGVIRRLDTSTNTLVGPGRKVSRFGGKMLFHAGSLWIAVDNGITRLDPDSLRRTGRIALTGGQGFDFTFTGNTLWVTQGAQARSQYGELLRFDATSQRSLGPPIPLPFGQPVAVTPAGDAVWVSAREGGTVTRVAAAGGAPRSTVVGLETLFSAVEGDAVWVPTDETIVRVGADGAIERVARVPGRPFVAARAGDSLWIAGLEPSDLQRIDPETGALMGEPLPMPNLGFIAEGLGDLWVSLLGEIRRIRPADPGPSPESVPLAPPGVLPPGPVPAGQRLNAEQFVVPLSVEVPSEEWLTASSRQRDGMILIWRPITRQPVEVVVYAPRVLFTADGGLTRLRSTADALAALRARPDLVVGPARPATVAGQPAVEVDVTPGRQRPIKGLCDTPCSLLFPLGQGLTINLESDERIRVRLIERAGRVLFVWYDVGPSGDARYRAEAQAVIDSIRFGDG